MVSGRFRLWSELQQPGGGCEEPGTCGCSIVCVCRAACALRKEKMDLFCFFFIFRSIQCIVCCGLNNPGVGGGTWLCPCNEEMEESPGCMWKRGCGKTRAGERSLLQIVHKLTDFHENTPHFLMNAQETQLRMLGLLPGSSWSIMGSNFPRNPKN